MCIHLLYVDLCRCVRMHSLAYEHNTHKHTNRKEDGEEKERKNSSRPPFKTPNSKWLFFPLVVTSSTHLLLSYYRETEIVKQTN